MRSLRHIYLQSFQMLTCFVKLMIFKYNLINNLANTEFFFKSVDFFFCLFIRVNRLKTNKFSFCSIPQRQLLFDC